MKAGILRTQWQRLPERTIRRLQAEKLRHYLERVVLPFSPHYRKLFAELGITANAFRSLEDLSLIPFSSKADLVTPENPTKFRDFILTPDPKVLARRPSTIVKALLDGKEAVRRGFEAEFRPVFMTSTTGR